MLNFLFYLAPAVANEVAEFCPEFKDAIGAVTGFITLTIFAMMVAGTYNTASLCPMFNDGAQPQLFLRRVLIIPSFLVKRFLRTRPVDHLDF